jgi:F0F1-type ATP synthase assembly protein I
MTPPEPDAEEHRPPIKPLPGAAAFLGMGLSAAACVGVGVVLGVLGDNAWHTSPLLLVLGLVLGLASAVASVVAQIRQFL